MNDVKGSMIFKSLAVLFGVFLVLGALAKESASLAGVVINEAVIILPAPSQHTAVGYVQILNNTLQPATLLSVTSTLSERVEIHRHQIVDGKMQMRQLQTLTVAPEQQLQFSPGALHLMLFDINVDALKGHTTTLIFHFEGMPSITVTAEVKAFGQRPYLGEHSH